jgi:hypothetical protein
VWLPDAASRRPVLPLVGSRGAPRTRVRKLESGHGFRSTRTAFPTPCGPSSSGPRPKPKLQAGPPCAFAPLQRRTTAAPHQSVAPPSVAGWATRPADAASPGLSYPTTQSRTGGPAVVTANPFAAACHVRGLATSLAASTTDPPGARSAGASLGFTLQGVLLAHERCPSRGPCPPDVAVGRLPGRRRDRAAAFRALFPWRVRAAAGFPKEPGRRCLPGLLPSRALPPSVRALACSHEAGPLDLGRGDVPTLLVLRASRSEWVGLFRFRTAGSPGVLHLPTVVAPRSSVREAGSWFHLTQDTARHRTAPTAILASSIPMQPWFLGPRPGATVLRSF